MAIMQNFLGAGIESKVSPLIDSAGSRYSLLLKKIMQCQYFFFQVFNDPKFVCQIQNFQTS